MSKILFTGVYFEHYTNGHTDSLNFREIENYAKNIPGVSLIGNSNDLPPVEKETFISKIKNHRVEQIILAGYSPGMLQPFFAGIMSEIGLSPANLIICSFKEYGAIKSADTEFAKALLFCAIKGVPIETIITSGKPLVNDNTLVIGGGIAGIQASLEIANSNHKVYLLERTGTIGGHMAMFDKTFPTLDCAACILTPKMVDVGLHPNIDLLTCSEIKEVSGEPGNYKVKILKKTRRVDMKTCIGCGICSEKCPSKAPSEFDAGTTLRKSIYIPFPQAVPNKYLIDAESCIYVKNGKCGVCAKVCPANAVRLDERDEMIEIDIGNIVLATGFQTFNAARAEQFGYGKSPKILTSLELERLVNAAGPTGGAITQRSQDKKGNWIFTAESEEPESVAIIHCVGSRDVNQHKYCSKVCCMYSLKLAHLIAEKLPEAEVFEYYIDMRAYGKGYEEFYERIKGEGIHLIRGRTSMVDEKHGKLHLRTEDIINSRLIEQEVDMLILAVGLEPRSDAAEISQILCINTDEDGWFEEANYISNPTNTFNGGITLAGACQGPKDIPDSVAQASAAASQVIQNIINGKVKILDKKMPLEEIEATARQLAEKDEEFTQQ